MQTLAGKTPGRFRRIAWILAVSYAAWVAIWFLLWLIVRDDLWWLALLNRVVPQMFAPAPIVVLIAMLARERKAIGASLVPLLIFAMVYWPYVLPRAAPVGGGQTLRVMTHNVLFSNTDYGAVADVILEYQPDLIALQEVQPAMMAALVEQLDEVYPYSLMADANPFGTTAAFSRYPVIDSYLLDLGADRPAVVLIADVEGQPVTFISAHLLAYGLEWIPLPEFPQTVARRIFEQERQARLLGDEATKHVGPVILACDCNSKETSGSYRILAETMTNAARAVGRVIDAPTLAGAARDTDLEHIDYVFYRGSLTALEVDTIRNTGGSDHPPVIALLALQH